MDALHVIVRMARCASFVEKEKDILPVGRCISFFWLILPWLECSSVLYIEMN